VANKTLKSIQSRVYQPISCTARDHTFPSKSLNFAATYKNMLCIYQRQYLSSPIQIMEKLISIDLELLPHSWLQGKGGLVTAGGGMDNWKRSGILPYQTKWHSKCFAYLHNVMCPTGKYIDVMIIADDY